MITVQSIIDKCESALDAEGFDRYIFSRDYKPAINYAQDWVITLLNSLFETNKEVASALKDLLYVKCFMLSDLSRVDFDETDIGQKLWTIIAVYTDITYDVNGGTPPSVTGHNSYYLDKYIYINSYFSAKLLTKEQANANRLNPFAQGNEIITSSEVKQPAYINWSNYMTGSTEIQLVPAMPNDIIAIEYLKTPNEVTATTDNIELPLTMTNLIVEKSLSWLSYKQGTSTLKQVSEYNANSLIKLII
jgi:hypothetical protein